MPAVSQAQRGYLNAKFGHAWVKRHHFDNKGKLPQHVGDKGGKKMYTTAENMAGGGNASGGGHKGKGHSHIGAHHGGHGTGHGGYKAQKHAKVHKDPDASAEHHAMNHDAGVCLAKGDYCAGAFGGGGGHKDSY